MRRKASVLRLSPNEEAQLVREELESRRKLRLQQVWAIYTHTHTNRTHTLVNLPLYIEWLWLEH